MKVCEAIRGNFRSAGARVIRAVVTARDRLSFFSPSAKRRRERERESVGTVWLERLVILLLSRRRTGSDTLKKAAGSIVSLILTSIKCNRVSSARDARAGARMYVWFVSNV